MNCFEHLNITIILNSEVLRVKHEGDKQVNFWRDLREFRWYEISWILLGRAKKSSYRFFWKLIVIVLDG